MAMVPWFGYHPVFKPEIDALYTEFTCGLEGELEIDTTPRTAHDCLHYEGNFPFAIVTGGMERGQLDSLGNSWLDLSGVVLRYLSRKNLDTPLIAVGFSKIGGNEAYYTLAGATSVIMAEPDTLTTDLVQAVTECITNRLFQSRMLI